MDEDFWVFEVLFSKCLNKQVHLTLTIIIFQFSENGFAVYENTLTLFQKKKHLIQTVYR